MEMMIRLRLIEIEFFGAEMSELRAAAEAHAARQKLDIFSETIKGTEAQPTLVVTYTNPDVPWLSAEEPMTVSVS
jgi:hypothetical protein